MDVLFPWRKENAREVDENDEYAFKMRGGEDGNQLYDDSHHAEDRTNGGNRNSNGGNRNRNRNGVNRNSTSQSYASYPSASGTEWSASEAQDTYYDDAEANNVNGGEMPDDNPSLASSQTSQSGGGEGYAAAARMGLPPTAEDDDDYDYDDDDNGGGGGESLPPLPRRRSRRSEAPQDVSGAGEGGERVRVGPTYSGGGPTRMEVSPSGNPIMRLRVPEDEMDAVEKTEVRNAVDLAAEGPVAMAAEANRRRRKKPTAVGGGPRAEPSSPPPLKSSKSANAADEGPRGWTVLSKDGRSGYDGNATIRRNTAALVAICLLGSAALLLTLAGAFHPQDTTDWIEPVELAKIEESDWVPDMDAPRPLRGAEVPPDVDSHLADWMGGTTRIPSKRAIDGFGSVTLSQRTLDKDLPLLWDEPDSGTNIIESAMGGCLKLIQASDEGTAAAPGFGSDSDTRLTVLYTMGKRYVNVDVTTPEGIRRARDMSLAASGIADVVVTPLLHDAARELFRSPHSGRLFVLMRHPVYRALARLRRMRSVPPSHPEYDPDFGGINSYEAYAGSSRVEENPVTRALVQKPSSGGKELTKGDMLAAKELLRRKAVIGLHQDIPRAVRHFARYFGWDDARHGEEFDREIIACVENAVLGADARELEAGKDLGPMVTEGFDVWKKILEKNRFDHELFMYSQVLYRYQMQLN